MVTPLLKKFVGLLFLFLVSFASQADNSSDSTKWTNGKIKISNDSIKARIQESLKSKIDSSNSVYIATESTDQFYEDGLILHNIQDNDSIRAIIDKASAVLEKIKKTQNFITNLNSTTGFELPVGISKTIGGLNYDIGIQAIRLKPTYAEIDVYMQFEVPQSGKKLTFMARGIKFSKAGGIIGDAKLVLVGDYAINFNGDKSQLVLKGAVGGTEGTFVRMDCDGFREMGLDAEVRFSRDLLIPEDASGVVKPTGNVTAAFKSTISNWNDLLVQISLPHFQIAGLTGFGFSIDNAVFDFSDSQNAPSVVFPKGYAVETDPSLVNLWRGIYVRQLSVRLPSLFKNKQNTSTSLTATDLLIDHQGVSGMFTGKNLIPLENGDMSGWAFSLDSIAVSLMANQIQQAGLKGNIVIPVSDKQNAFKYTASFRENNQYLFDITSTQNMQFNMFQTSKVEIYKGSSLEIRIDNDRFLPKAILNGKMDINAKLSEGGQGVQLADITFENLQIQSVQPYIQVGNFSFGSDVAKQLMAGFPIHVTGVSMKNITPYQVGLTFDMKLNLVGESAGAFAADAGLTIIAELSNGDQQSWKYKEIQVRNIDIDIDQGEAFKFKGSLVFYRQDPVYGDGFNGALSATFLSKIKVNASAIFGNLNGERYWYADALVKFTPGIPFFPGVGFYGFGGGAYYRMKMDGNNSSPLGKTASGVSYIPALENGLGLKAIVYLGSMPTEKAFTADVTFEMAFFKSGGIHSISMTGNAFIATPEGLESSLDKLKSTVGNMRVNLPKLEQALNSRVGQAVSRITGAEIANTKLIQGDIGGAAGDKGGISAHVYISYDFENSTLHGNFDTQINIAAGLIKGGGDAVLHFAPHEWYVYVGTPDQRFTISIGVGPIRANASSYFMVGTSIPGSPPPPPEVSQILGGRNLDYMKDLNAIGNGAGFAFGAALSIKTGDLTFLMFYANFSAGAGFDIMVKDYGNTYCEGSNSRIGINGWYANGQAYAYFMGEIGIKVTLFWSTENIKILSIGAAAVLQAKLPNPIWMQGNVGGYFSVLGGLVSGQCSFQVTLGNECKLVKKNDDSALKNIAVISQLTPGVGETEVNVFNNPQVVFNLAVNKQFDLADANSHQAYRVNLDFFKLTVDGNPIPGALQWNDNQTVVAFNSADVLPPKKEIKSSVQVSFEKLVNGAWQKVVTNGQPYTEKQEVTFTTGTAPDYIPLSNVQYSYPVIGQLNFYKGETNAGYIKLKKGQPYLFSPGPEWNQVGRVKESSGSKVSFDFTYNSANALLNLTIPGSSLKTGMIYDFELVNVPKNASGTIDRNVSAVSSQVNLNGQSTNTEIKTQQAQGSIVQLQEKTIFLSYFRTSQYSTLGEKVSKLNSSPGWIWALSPGVYELGTTFQGSEFFDKQEFVSSNYDQDRTIGFEADIDNSWYNEKVFPLIYKDYPWNNVMKIGHRSESPLGIPALRSIYARQTPSDLALADADVSARSYTYPVQFASIIYNLPREMYLDYLELQAVAANLSLTQNDARLNTLLLTPFPVLQQTNYKIKVKHQLPGTGQITSESILNINYSIQFAR